ncbi:InlB B-repeat-containing protein [Neobacillus sp. NPDC058068]|uniref:InlB B-repeat-containing protein n=1 Tax=Neobacillus sp. NPDC058068 TaxID=3346325 RepID=UPI0036DCFED0
MPEKPGYTFAGWYKDTRFQELFSDQTSVDSDMNLYAKFIKNPSTPSKVTVSNNGYDQLKLSWAPVIGANKYEIYRATSKNRSYSPVSVVSGNTTSAIMNNLDTGTAYYFKVAALYESNGQTIYGDYSNVVSAAPR